MTALFVISIVFIVFLFFLDTVQSLKHLKGFTLSAIGLCGEIVLYGIPILALVLYSCSMKNTLLFVLSLICQFTVFLIGTANMLRKAGSLVNSIILLIIALALYGVPILTLVLYSVR